MKSIIAFASGKGSNIQAIINHFKGNNAFNISLIVVNKKDAGAIQIARAHNIPFIIIDRDIFQSVDFLEKIKSLNPTLLVLAGFLWKIPENIVHHFPNKIINIHPALLPKYGGKGMYGINVHQAVINAKETESGITIHYVNEHYDEGSQICQVNCFVHQHDTAESLA
mgnify:CR=1 FL=1